MLNQAVLIGRLSQDPDLQYTQGGTPFIEFSVADDSLNQDEAQFVDVIAWGDSAENHDEYLSKGSTVAVAGKLDIGKWKDDDGKTRYSPQIRAFRVVYLSRPDSEDSEPQPNDPSDFKEEDDEEDIPF